MPRRTKKWMQVRGNHMKMLKTVESAKKAIKDLQDFVSLVESYEVTTIEQKVLKEYAYTGIMAKVVENIN